jgi:hypothetical protein
MLGQRDLEGGDLLRVGLDQQEGGAGDLSMGLADGWWRLRSSQPAGRSGCVQPSCRGLESVRHAAVPRRFWSVKS